MAAHAEHDKGIPSPRSRARQDFLKLVNEPNLSNVSFLCQDEGVIYALKEILAARSDFFHKLLFGGLKEATQDQVHLPTAQSSHLLKVFEFLHTGECSLSEKPIAELFMGVYELSRQYTIEDLQKELLNRLPGFLNEANVGEYLMLGSQVIMLPISRFFLR